MRSADIEIGRDYRAEVGFREFIRVTVLATRVRWDRGYGGPNRVKNDGVRVRLSEPAGKGYGATIVTRPAMRL